MVTTVWGAMEEVMRPYIFPLDQHPDDKLPDGAEAWLVELERQKGKGKQEVRNLEAESSWLEIV